ncbi:MAG: XdhC family protein [Methylococcaceae bacterium]|nr:XdhC family protein [Methylococcaceae bacterium]
MSNQTSFWQWLVDALEHNGSIMLMIVVSSQGSSPGKAGAKMAVTAQGQRFGTIGGGAVEHSLVKQAQLLLTNDTFHHQLIREQHHLSTTGQASGMICGGEQTVLMYVCQSSELKLYRQSLNKLRGVIKLSPAGIEFNQDCTLPFPSRFNLLSEDDWIYEERVGVGKQAYLIGGGHVSLALSKILATLDFDITVIDERDNLDTFNRNTDAHHKLIISYQDIQSAIPEGDQVFIFIMTHSYKTDEKVTEQLADKKVRYLGILGSHKKIAQLKANLSNKVSLESIQRIRGPIGLPINSHTPEEIAISIAAELVQLLNQFSG